MYITTLQATPTELMAPRVRSVATAAVAAAAGGATVAQAGKRAAAGNDSPNSVFAHLVIESSSFQCDLASSDSYVAQHLCFLAQRRATSP